ncbi:hypothetical protein [Bernardetia sp.]|uniref:hypothetical protein n=1 Tax=Bernardetia sp. TaxID=1937974 RepID=UPI0025B93DEB|nr:hypothetical protein [Bernardetia sp.]
MRLYWLIFLFFAGHITISEASQPSKKVDFYQNNIQKIDSDSTQKIIKNNTRLPPKPKNNGFGMILRGVLLTMLGTVFGVGILLTFLFGFSVGSGFYFGDIYATAGIMLGGLVIFGLGIFMLSRGKERWKAYKRYRKALKKMKNNA